MPSRLKPLASKPCCDRQTGNFSTKNQYLDSHDGEQVTFLEILHYLERLTPCDYMTTRSTMATISRCWARRRNFSISGGTNDRDALFRNRGSRGPGATTSCLPFASRALEVQQPGSLLGVGDDSCGFVYDLSKENEMDFSIFEAGRSKMGGGSSKMRFFEKERVLLRRRGSSSKMGGFLRRWGVFFEDGGFFEDGVFSSGRSSSKKKGFFEHVEGLL